MLYIHETFLVYKLDTFKNCKEVKHIMIMVIAIIYICFILCDIWSTVENYFQKIFSPPWKKPLPPFHSLPSKNSKSAIFPFLPTFNIFQPPPCRKVGEDTVLFQYWKYDMFNWDSEKSEIVTIDVSDVV